MKDNEKLPAVLGCADTRHPDDRPGFHTLRFQELHLDDKDKSKGRHASSQSYDAMNSIIEKLGLNSKSYSRDR